jgi:hypothetical protein
MGHGDSVEDDFYLCRKNARYPPRSGFTLNLAYEVKELRREFSNIDGLVVLVDTCYSGAGAQAVAKAWPSLDIEFRRSDGGCVGFLLVQVDRAPKVLERASRYITRGYQPPNEAHRWPAPQRRGFSVVIGLT